MTDTGTDTAIRPPAPSVSTWVAFVSPAVGDQAEDSGGRGVAGPTGSDVTPAGAPRHPARLALVAVLSALAVSVVLGGLLLQPGPAPRVAWAAGTPVGGTPHGAGSAYFDPTPDSFAQLGAPATFIASTAEAADPFVLVANGTFYLYTSQTLASGANVPVQAGTAMGHFGRPFDAMPVPPKWVVPGFTWAPDVHRYGAHYVLYFTAVLAGTTPSKECIGVALGTRALGPFRPAPLPLVCQLSQGGSIDPRTFTDTNGTTYLLWKSDDNLDGASAPTSIYAQPLTANGLGLVGSATRIFGPDEPWQGSIVEAPDMVVAHGAYWLFYSGGWFNQNAYAVGAAKCASPLGPCADTSAYPLLGSNAQGEGPGEESVLSDAEGIFLLYTPQRADTPEVTPPRPVAMVRLGFGPVGPYLAN